MGALPVHHTATTDEPWDGPAAVAAMPNDATVLRYCHAWQDSASDDGTADDPDGDADDQKSSYKFPHHKTKGGPANLAACRNGLARLDGAKIPEGDKAGVTKHLQAHLDDAENGADDAWTTRLASEPKLGSWASYGRMNTAERVNAHMPRAQRLSASAEWFRITDAAPGGTARLDLFDEIGFWGVSASDFNAALGAISADRLAVHINSPGGDVFDGIAILNMLRAHPAAVDVTVDGLAASAASFIAMAGDTVTMMPNSELMIHDASGLCIGNPADMTAMAGLLERVSDNIASIYAARTGTDAATWRDAMRAETWYSADEAVAAGLADTVAELPGGKKAAKNSAWNLSFYAYDGRAHAPAPLIPAPTAAPAPTNTLVFDPTEFRNAMKEAAG